MFSILCGNPAIYVPAAASNHCPPPLSQHFSGSHGELLETWKLLFGGILGLSGPFRISEFTSSLVPGSEGLSDYVPVFFPSQSDPRIELAPSMFPRIKWRVRGDGDLLVIWGGGVVNGEHLNHHIWIARCFLKIHHQNRRVYESISPNLTFFGNLFQLFPK